MGKVKLLALTAIFLLATCACYATRTCEEAEELLSKGEFNDGLVALNSIVRNRNSPDHIRFRAMMRLARFYEETTGQFDLAASIYGEIAKSRSLNDNSSYKRSAREKMDRIAKQSEKFHEEDKMLAAYSSETGDSGELSARLADLNGLITSKPEFPNMERAFFLQGVCYSAQGRHKEAYHSFMKSLEIRPGLSMLYPVKVRMENAREKWIRQRLVMFSVMLLWTVLALLVILFAVAKPWNWLRTRDILIFIGVMAAWTALFPALNHLLSTDLVKPDSMKGVRVWISKSPFDDGAINYFMVFGWSCAALFATYAISVCTATVIRNSALRMLSNLLLSVVLVLSLSTVFYLKHSGEGRKEFIFEAGSGRLPSSGSMYFVLGDILPYAMTDPSRYDQFYYSLETTDDPFIRAWMEKYARPVEKDDDYYAKEQMGAK